MKYWQRNKAEFYMLLIALTVYGINKALIKQITGNWFVQGYLNDVMAGICLLIIAQCLMDYWLKRQMGFLENIFLICAAGAYWELIVPLYIAASVKDINDLAAYLTGGMILMTIRKLIQIKKEGEQKMKCKKCGCELDSQAKFCPSCGEKVITEQHCSNCGAILEAGAKFCVRCGNSVMHEKIAQASVQEKDTRIADKPALENREAAFILDKTDTEDAGSVIEPENQNPDIGIDSEKPVPEYGIRTLESFKTELKELGDRDGESKAVIIAFGTGVLYKHFYSLLRNDEKLLAIRNIQGKFLFARYRKEFVAVTDKRVIKFEKMQYFKPKAESCYLSDIREITADSPSNAVSGTFIGEKLGITHSGGRIDMRMIGKGAAGQLKERILKEKEGTGSTKNEDDIATAYIPDMELPKAGPPKAKKKGGNRKFVFGIVAVVIVLAVLAFIGGTGSKSEMQRAAELCNKVRDGYLGYYGSVTLGNVFDEVLPGGGWEGFFTDSDELIIQYSVPQENTNIQFKVSEDQKSYHVVHMEYLGEIMTEASDSKMKLDSIYAEYFKKHPELGQFEIRSWDNVTTDGHFTPLDVPESIKAEKTPEVSEGFFIFPDSDKRFLEDNEIEKLTDNERLTALYEIMARHGATFEDAVDGEEWQNYFNNKEWYKPVAPAEEIPDSELNIYEGSNIQKISDIITSTMADGQYDYYMYLPDSDSIYYTESDLKNLTAEELRIARNEIYARHGRKFETEDLNQYFSRQPWYNGYLTADEFDDSVLNEYEKTNLDLLKAMENEGGSIGGIRQLTPEDVSNIVFGSNNSDVTMEIGTYSGTGEIYVVFSNSYGELWRGDLNRYESLEYGGILFMFNGSSGSSENLEFLTVEWTASEAIDFPSVEYEHDTMGISGTYSYDHMLGGN